MSMMEKIEAAYRKADPQRNSNIHDRQVALSMAHKIMDKYGIDAVSLNISMDDLIRIEGQTFVSVGVQETKLRKSWFWRSKPKASTTSTSDTGGYASSSSEGEQSGRGSSKASSEAFSQQCNDYLDNYSDRQGPVGWGE